MLINLCKYSCTCNILWASFLQRSHFLQRLGVRDVHTHTLPYCNEDNGLPAQSKKCVLIEACILGSVIKVSFLALVETGMNLLAAMRLTL